LQKSVPVVICVSPKHTNHVSLPFCRPGDQPCFEAQEFDLVRSMLIAAVEERYKDAGKLLMTCKNKIHVFPTFFGDEQRSDFFTFVQRLTVYLILEMGLFFFPAQYRDQLLKFRAKKKTGYNRLEVSTSQFFFSEAGTYAVPNQALLASVMLQYCYTHRLQV
jgi:hypothetical protein